MLNIVNIWNKCIVKVNSSIFNIVHEHCSFNGFSKHEIVDDWCSLLTNVFIVINEKLSSLSSVLIWKFWLSFLIRFCFRQWRETIHDEKTDRELNTYALDHYHRCLKRKVLLHWNNEMIQQVLIDNENQRICNDYLEKKNRVLLSNIYEQWREKTERYARERVLSLRANEFYEKKLLRKVFDLWKDDYRFNLRIKVIKKTRRSNEIYWICFSYSIDKRFGSIECVVLVEFIYNGSKHGKSNRNFTNKNKKLCFSGQFNCRKKYFDLIEN